MEWQGTLQVMIAADTQEEADAALAAAAHAVTTAAGFSNDEDSEFNRDISRVQDVDVLTVLPEELTI
jgi:hypothetical protein